MTNLIVEFLAALSGKGKGVTANSALNSPLGGRTFNVSMSTTGSGGGKATNGYAGSRPLSASANETLDLRSFTNLLGETAQALGTLRFFFVRHTSTSSASSISVGNSGANALIIKGCLGATTADLLPGQALLFLFGTSTAVTVDATHKDVKVANNDGSNAATYEIGWFGE